VDPAMGRNTGLPRNAGKICATRSRFLACSSAAATETLTSFGATWRASTPRNQSRTSLGGWSRECLILLNS
jgi:hypothetical protein